MFPLEIRERHLDGIDLALFARVQHDLERYILVARSVQFQHVFIYGQRGIQRFFDEAPGNAIHPILVAII